MILIRSMPVFSFHLSIFKINLLCQSECALKADNCDDVSEDCTDSVGSFVCSCKNGFNGTAPGGCINEDECAASINPCGPFARCDDTVGGFKCTCPPEYPFGDPPDSPCRKAEEYESCPSSDDRACESGFFCANKSRSDNSTVCCRETERCYVDQDCCTGFYTVYQNCPSGLDMDCRGDLVCGKAFAGLLGLVCCNFAIGDILTSTKNCIF